jgi:hypothetical protein
VLEALKEAMEATEPRLEQQGKAMLAELTLQERLVAEVVLEA